MDMFDELERQESNLIPFTEEHIKDYLDNAIRSWRKKRDKIDPPLSNPEDHFMATCYIDAFQSVRMTLFGELLK